MGSGFVILEKGEKETMWTMCDGLFDDEHEAEGEINEIIRNSPGSKRSDFHIIPNDGSELRTMKYRPLDLGDRILASHRR